MTYKILNYIKTCNWEGAIIEDQDTKKKFITNGVYKWDFKEERLRKIEIVESIDKKSFMKFWNRHFEYEKILT